MECASTYPNASPAAPPSTARSPLSIRCCRNSRARPAPSARRTADSRCLPTERASSRFATLAHTISSRTPTSSIRIQRALVSAGPRASRPRFPGKVISRGSCWCRQRPACSGTARRPVSSRPFPTSRFQPANLTDPPVPIVLRPRRGTVLIRLEGDFHGERRVDVRPDSGPEAEEPGRSDADIRADTLLTRRLRSSALPPRASRFTQNRWLTITTGSAPTRSSSSRNGRRVWARRQALGRSSR